MYAKLTYFAGGHSNALADIVAVLTGETDLNNLSSDVQEADSQIFNTNTNAGWELHDQVSDEDVVLRQPYSTESQVEGEYKYIRLFRYNSFIIWEPYRSWDETAHTGVTNKRVTTTGADITTTGQYNYIFYNITTGCTIYLSSSPWHFAVVSERLSNNYLTGISMISERTRESPWDIPSNNFNPMVYTSYPIRQKSFSNSSIDYRTWFTTEKRPSTSNLNTVYDVNNGTSDASQCYYYSYTAINSNIKFPYTGTFKGTDGILNEDNTLTVPIYEFGCTNPNSTDFGGNLSSLNGIYLTTSVYNHGEIVTGADGTLYAVWNYGATDNLAYSLQDEVNQRFLVTMG